MISSGSNLHIAGRCLDAARALLDRLQEPERLLPAPPAPIQQLAPGRRRQRGEDRVRCGEVEGGELRHGDEDRDRIAGSEEAAGGFEAGEVGGGEAAGGEDFEDEVGGEVGDGEGGGHWRSGGRSMRGRI